MNTQNTPEFRQAMAVAHSIATRPDKRGGILFLCQCWKQMLVGEAI